MIETFFGLDTSAHHISYRCACLAWALNCSLHDGEPFRVPQLAPHCVILSNVAAMDWMQWACLSKAHMGIMVFMVHGLHGLIAVVPLGNERLKQNQTNINKTCYRSEPLSDIA